MPLKSSLPDIIPSSKRSPEKTCVAQIDCPSNSIPFPSPKASKAALIDPFSFLPLPFFLGSSPPSSSLPFDPIPHGERERDVAESCEQCLLMVVGEPHQDEAVEMARQQSPRSTLLLIFISSKFLA
ncbi:hypothetical protein Cni_G10658 [Canna indica]|uniref:Uncharacterized protein n=1 Tax=Canna indica TaxID=4628 RepID=A0AAQ3K678_9LILI|nr:hypothetical protein Cni_G10658 [Canna indica]